jgi:hypothetical protein
VYQRWKEYITIDELIVSVYPKKHKSKKMRRQLCQYIKQTDPKNTRKINQIKEKGITFENLSLVPIVFGIDVYVVTNGTNVVTNVTTGIITPYIIDIDNKNDDIILLYATENELGNLTYMLVGSVTQQQTQKAAPKVQIGFIRRFIPHELQLIIDRDTFLMWCVSQSIRETRNKDNWNLNGIINSIETMIGKLNNLSDERGTIVTAIYSVYNNKNILDDVCK